MRDGRRVPQPTELAYVPSPSWAPVLAAAGLAIVGIGLFAGLAYAAVGGVIAIGALWAWIRSVANEIDRLPRQQRVSTAVLPAVPLRGSDSNS
jgi:membrane associated rhomboid family serine protease